MPKIRRAGYIFLARRSDHAPRHVHVYRSGRLVVKWDGRASTRIVELITELEGEGRL